MRIQAAAVALILLLPAARSAASEHTVVEMILDINGTGWEHLFNPSGVASGPDGAIYVAGRESHNVFRIPKNGGPVTTIATSSDGLDHPYRLAVGPEGNVYVNSLLGGTYLDRIFPSGFVDLIDFGVGLSSQIATDSAGNVYAVSINGVVKRTTGGTTTEVIGQSGLGGVALIFSQAVAADGSGNAYVVGRDSDNVFRISPGGVVTEILDATAGGAGILDGPSAVAADASGNVYVAAADSQNAFKITSGGVVTELIDASGSGGTSPLVEGRGIAVGPSGNVYVAGVDNVFRITPGGVVTEIIDSSGAGAGKPLLNISATGPIAVDSSENVYVSGSSSHNAFRISSGGTITEILDSTGDGLGNTLFGAAGVAIDASDNVYVSGWGTENVFKITPAGVVSEVIDSSGDGAGADLNNPYAISVDGAGNLLVYDEWYPNYYLFQVTPAGSISVLFDMEQSELGFGEFIGGTSVAVRSTGTALLASPYTNTVIELAPGGSTTAIIDVRGDGTGKLLLGAYGLAVDASANVYVTGSESNNAFRITPAGAITQIIDGDGDQAGNELEDPFGIDVDAAGNVYVVGWDSANLFRIEPGGAITELLDATGDGMGNPLVGPLGVAVDSEGNAYVSGSDSGNVFHVAPDGAVREILDASGDGQGNTLSWPEELALSRDEKALIVLGYYSDNVFRIGPPRTVPGLSPAGLVILASAIVALGSWAATREPRRSLADER
jgi:uncharacterized protein YjiK